jgi:transposase
MQAWQLTDAEWDTLGRMLADPEASVQGPGRPRLENGREAAEACLYRHYHTLAESYRCFGWNALPTDLGVSPSTANRRFREWTASGAWERFWDGLMRLRHGPARTPNRRRRTARQCDKRFPVRAVLAELERAYEFFNEYFFGGTLPQEVAIALERQTSRRCRGYFCARLWRQGAHRLGHIALSTSALGSAEAGLSVLLHEMVHLRNDQVGVSDCAPGSQYHNRHFRDVAVLAGLQCAARDARFGYAETHLSERGRQAITLLHPQDDVFRWDVG